MTIDWIRDYCLSLPYTKESVQWGDDLVFKVGGKMFAIAVLEPANFWLCFKCSPDEFSDLIELPGILPAPYLARRSWVALETEDTLPTVEVKRLVRCSYEMVLSKLPVKVRAGL